MWQGNKKRRARCQQGLAVFFSTSRAYQVPRLPQKENPLKQFIGCFRTVERKLREQPVIGFDTEDNSKGVVTLYGFYGDAGGWATRQYKEAIDYIYNIDQPTTFCAHNLEYDIVNFFKHDNLPR